MSRCVSEVYPKKYGRRPRIRSCRPPSASTDPPIRSTVFSCLRPSRNPRLFGCSQARVKELQPTTNKPSLWRRSSSASRSSVPPLPSPPLPSPPLPSPRCANARLRSAAPGARHHVRCARHQAGPCGRRCAPALAPPSPRPQLASLRARPPALALHPHAHTHTPRNSKALPALQGFG